MSYEPKPAQSVGDAESVAPVKTNGHSDYNGGYYQGSVARFITPGGNPIDNSQPAFPGMFPASMEGRIRADRCHE
jgi:hypothetical protein